VIRIKEEEVLRDPRHERGNALKALKTHSGRVMAYMLLVLPAQLLIVVICATTYASLEVPSNVAAIDAYNVGVACLPTKAFQCAIDAFTQAVTFEPTFYRAWQNLALAYDYTSRHIEAHAAHQEALNHGYYNYLPPLPYPYSFPSLCPSPCAYACIPSIYC
jgi:hypothetical protein